MSRLGYRLNTNISKKQNDKINNVINIGILNCELKGVYIRQKIIKQDKAKIILEKNIVWNSSKLVDFLSTSKDMFVIGVTAGSKIVETRDNYIKQDDLFSSVIIDAVGSEMAEACAKWLHDFLNKSVLKEGKKLTKTRYSPGYGDFALINQKSIYNLLELNKIGVELSSHFILKPEKSITAVIGVMDRQIKGA